MKSQLVPLSKKLIPIEVIKPLPFFHRVYEKQVLSGTECSYHWNNSERQEEGSLINMKPRNFFLVHYSSTWAWEGDSYLCKLGGNTCNP